MLDYPGEEDEYQMVLRWGKTSSQPSLTKVSNAEELLSLRAEIDGVHMAEPIHRYMLALVRTTRELARVPAPAPSPSAAGGAAGSAGVGKRSAKPMLAYGGSPRASLSLYQASKALAWLRGRDFVTPGLLQEIFLDVMRHRVGLTYHAEADGVTADEILRGVIQRTPVPSLASAESP